METLEDSIKILSIYREKLKFLYIDDEKVFEEKVDILITTARLMGYSIKEFREGYDLTYRFRSYSFVLLNEDKRVELSFKERDDVIYGVYIEYNNWTTLIPLRNEKKVEEVLKELDKLLIYI